MKCNEVQGLLMMANTPLYGCHITIAGEGPRSQQPHAPRIILGPFGVTPRTPNYHRYIIQNLGIQYWTYCLVFSTIGPW